MSDLSENVYYLLFPSCYFDLWILLSKHKIFPLDLIFGLSNVPFVWCTVTGLFLAFKNNLQKKFNLVFFIWQSNFLPAFKCCSRKYNTSKATREHKNSWHSQHTQNNYTDCFYNYQLHNGYSPRTYIDLCSESKSKSKSENTINSKKKEEEDHQVLIHGICRLARNIYSMKMMVQWDKIMSVESMYLDLFLNCISTSFGDHGLEDTPWSDHTESYTLTTNNHFLPITDR